MGIGPINNIRRAQITFNEAVKSLHIFRNPLQNLRLRNPGNPLIESADCADLESQIEKAELRVAPATIRHSEAARSFP
jgi:hypothetical protein